MKNPKIKRPNRQPKNPDAGLPAADQQIAKHNRMVAQENEALRKEICKRYGNLRDDVEKLGVGLIKAVNESREIGFLIVEAWDKLPGKQMTLDFWEQQRELYKDAKGRPIELDKLKWMVRVSRELPKALTPEDMRQAMGYRQPLLELPGFHLEGDAPYEVNGSGSIAEKNFFTALKVDTEKFGKKFKTYIQSLEKNPRFGPLKTWDAERRAEVWLKVQPLYQELVEMKRELNILEA